MSSADFILKGGLLLLPTGHVVGDVAVSGGKIVAVGDIGEAKGEVIDCTGLALMPGAIDTQVHFREPGLTHKEDLESGTRAAICGGVTTIFEMPNTDPTTTTADALRDKLQRAEGRAWCDYAFFVGASKENIEDLPLLEMMPGTPGVKMFMGSSTGTLLVDDDDSVHEVMKHGVRPMPVHSEDEARLRQRKAELPENPHVRLHPDARDAESARLCTERLINLVRETGRPTHILHISTKEELPLLAAAKKEGLPVTCEVTPHHLTLNADRYEDLGSFIQMNPPVRSEDHRLAIWQAVKDGLFDVFGSDHAPHTKEEKAKPYPNSPSGMPGVQTLLPLMVDWALRGELPLEQVVAMLTANPAKLYGIEGKGSLAPGFDADIVAWDLEGSQEVSQDWLQSKCGWSPYEGTRLRGRIEHVFVRGHHTVQSGQLTGTPQGAMVRFDWK